MFKSCSAHHCNSVNKPGRYPMKPERVLTVILGAAVVVLTIMLISSKKTPLAEKPKAIAHTNTVEVWRTNTLELWRTNTVVTWRTNTVEMWRTNVVRQVVTNEVVKEVPAKLSEALQEAAVMGYKYSHAPTVVAGSGALYKVNPVSLQIQLTGSARELLSDEGLAALQAEGERTLRTHNMPIGKGSPYQLRLSIRPLWTTDVPGVIHCLFMLELREEVSAIRQSDVVKCAGVTWSSIRLGTVPKDNVAEELTKSLQAQLEQFCNDVDQAKKSEGAIESQLPKLPAGFLIQSE